jgi:hypothetical protein
MSTGFARKDVEQLLAACHRRCCVCHRVCGVKIETDHIVPKSEGGDDSIENAIPVCFECHAEIHSYNPQHPRGRKFTPDELRLHKEQWLEICRTRPEIFVSAPRDGDVGPLQALIDELDFNLVVAQQPPDSEPGCMFLDDQFRRAIKEGAISVLQDSLKRSLLEAYAAMGRANQITTSVLNTPRGTQLWKPAGAHEASRAAISKIEAAKKELLEFLSGG